MTDCTTNNLFAYDGSCTNYCYLSSFRYCFCKSPLRLASPTCTNQSLCVTDPLYCVRNLTTILTTSPRSSGTPLGSESSSTSYLLPSILVPLLVAITVLVIAICLVRRRAARRALDHNDKHITRFVPRALSCTEYYGTVGSSVCTLSVDGAAGTLSSCPVDCNI